MPQGFTQYEIEELITETLKGFYERYEIVNDPNIPLFHYSNCARNELSPTPIFLQCFNKRYYVYAINSAVTDRICIGLSNCIERRLWEPNYGRVKSTWVENWWIFSLRLRTLTISEMVLLTYRLSSNQPLTKSKANTPLTTMIGKRYVGSFPSISEYIRLMQLSTASWTTSEHTTTMIFVKQWPCLAMHHIHPWKPEPNAAIGTNHCINELLLTLGLSTNPGLIW